MMANWRGIVMAVLIFFSLGAHAAPAAPDGMLLSAQGYQMRIGGRVQWDALRFAGADAGLYDGTDVRRARIYLTGTLNARWKFRFQHDFADQAVKDLYLSYGRHGVRIEQLRVLLGQFTPPVSLENMSSSKWISALERPLVVDALVPDRELGVGVQLLAGAWSLGAALTGDNLAADDRGDEAPTLMSRWVWAPGHQSGDVVQLGMSLGWVGAPDDQVLRLGVRPEARVDDTPKLLQITVPGARGYWLHGLEGAWSLGSLSLQAEYLAAKLERGGGPRFAGHYLLLSWFSSGDRRSYDRLWAVFDRPVGGRGSWEWLMRYSQMDFSAQSDGQRQTNYTLGLNHYPLPGLRFGINLIASDLAARGPFYSALLRAQLVF